MTEINQRDEKMVALIKRIMAESGFSGQSLSRVAQARVDMTVRTIPTDYVHGLEVGDIVRFDSDISQWVGSLADTAAHAYIGGMVVSAPTDYVFVLATPGSYVTGLQDAGVSEGIMFLSASLAGKMTATAPGIPIPVLMADSDRSGIVLGGASSSSTQRRILINGGAFNKPLAYSGVVGAVYSATPITTGAPLATAYNPTAPVLITDNGIAYGVDLDNGNAPCLIFNRPVVSGLVSYGNILTHDLPETCIFTVWRSAQVPVSGGTTITAYEAYWA